MQHCIYSWCRKLWENNGGDLWTTHDECVRKKRSIYDHAELEKLKIITEREIRNYVISGKYAKLYKGMEKEERNMLLQSNGSWTTFHGKKTKYPEREEKLCKHVEQNILQGWVLNDPCIATIFHLLWSPFPRFSPQQSTSKGQYIVNTWEVSFSVQHEGLGIGKRTRNLRFEC